MTAKPSDEHASWKYLTDLIRLAKDLPNHLKFASIGLLVIGGIVLGSGIVSPEIVQGIIVGIILLVAMGLLADIYFKWTESIIDLRPLPGEPLMVGVLSLAAPGADGSESSIGDGFAAELIKRLGEIDDLNVKPQHAMLRYKQRKTPARKIAVQLNANCLVKGKLVNVFGRYRVDAEIIQAWDGGSRKQSWERPKDEWLQLQGDVAEWVADHLVAIPRGKKGKALTSEERLKIREHPTENVHANLMYMDAQSAMRNFNRERNTQLFLGAEAEFLHALRLDRNYIEARTNLGFLYLLNWETAGGTEWLMKSRKEFQEVIKKEPDHPVASAELGYLSFVNGAVDKGIDQVEAVARKHPRETIPQNVRALLHLYLGFYESAVEITREIILLDPDYIYPPTNASTACYLMGKCKDALWWAESPEKKAPSAFVIPLVEGTAWFCKGEMKAADRAWRRGLNVSPQELRSLFRVTRAWIYAAKGDLAAPRATVRDHQNEPWVSGAYCPFFISLCALSGEHDLALNLIRRQATWGSSYRYLISDPTLKSLRNHPDYLKLLQSRYDQWLRLTERMQDIPGSPTLPTPNEFLVGA